MLNSHVLVVVNRDTLKSLLENYWIVTEISDWKIQWPKKFGHYEWSKQWTKNSVTNSIIDSVTDSVIDSVTDFGHWFGH